MYESVEQALLLRVGVGGVLRMPLHADDPLGSGPFNGFDDTVIATTGHDQSVTEMIDGLMMERKARFGTIGSHRLCCA